MHCAPKLPNCWNLIQQRKPASSNVNLSWETSNGINHARIELMDGLKFRFWYICIVHLTSQTTPNEFSMKPLRYSKLKQDQNHKQCSWVIKDSNFKKRFDATDLYRLVIAGQNMRGATAVKYYRVGCKEQVKRKKEKRRRLNSCCCCCCCCCYSSLSSW